MLNETAHLPPAFELLPRLMLLLNDEEADCEALARLIRLDAGLTTDVVRVSNCTSFAGWCRSETVQDAIIRLGLREVFRITVKLIASPALEGAYSGSLGRLDLWQHSLAVAVASHVIADRINQDMEVAFTAGLLHDIGKTALARKCGAAYIDLFEECRTRNQPIRELELERLNLDHAAIGADLLAEWNFPQKIVDALRHHHTPALFDECDVLTSVTNLANTLSYRLGFGCGFPVETVQPSTSSLDRLGISMTEFEGLGERIAEAFRREREFLQEPVP